MKFNEETIENFFAGKKSFKIPEYQRTYSWDDEQLKTFWDDLCECRQSESGNPYCFGNIMAEKANDNEFEIIDGQQRLTTIVIFTRAILNEITNKQKTNNNFTNINIEQEERTFFKDYDKIKLVPLNLDKSCFDTIIIENKENYKCETLSQQRMQSAKKFFKDKLQKTSTEKIIEIYSILKSSKINFISLEGKKDSALMFELQNNRGKALTTLEKLKSFLMYQIYLNSPSENTNIDIDYVAQKFASIYRYTAQIEEYASKKNGNVTEDNILLYHSYAYSKKNLYYKNMSHIIEEYKSEDVLDKITWIKNYVDELCLTYANIKNFLNMTNENLTRLQKLDFPFFVYPFIIKAMKFFENNTDKLDSMFKIMEKLSFRYKLVNSRSDIRSRLNDIIKNFDGDIDLLVSQIETKMEEAYYWSDARVIETLNGNMYKNDDMLRYLLWEYEASLQDKGYKIDDLKIEGESIEHISPQTEDGEWIEAGYEVDENNHYSDKFKENYLNKLGNLMLISQSHNSQIGNKPFKNKLDSYNNNPILKQQTEIKNFIEDIDNPIWDTTAIDKRHKEILDFAKERWALKL